MDSIKVLTRHSETQGLEPDMLKLGQEFNKEGAKIQKRNRWCKQSLFLRIANALQLGKPNMYNRTTVQLVTRGQSKGATNRSNWNGQDPKSWDYWVWSWECELYALMGQLVLRWAFLKAVCSSLVSLNGVVMKHQEQ